MIGKDLPDKDHVIRYVRPTLIDNGVVSGGAFCLRKIETGLSVYWLEVFGGNKNYQINRARESCDLTPAKSGKFAELNVGITKRHVNSNSIYPQEIRIQSTQPNDKRDFVQSHSEIIGLPPANCQEAMLVGELIAECINNVHPGRID